MASEMQALELEFYHFKSRFWQAVSYENTLQAPTTIDVIIKVDGPQRVRVRGKHISS